MDRSDVVATFLAADDRAAMERVSRYRREHPGAEYNLDRFAVQSDRAHTPDQDQGQGGIIDVATDVAQNFAPRTLTTPGQGQQVFTGNWLIKDANSGEVIRRFGGIGNVQADANRVAYQWIRDNTNYDFREVEVVPEMA